MKKKVFSILALLLIAVSGAMAQSYTITLPSVSNGSVSAKVNDASVTSAAAGATVSLVATPDAGYRLKTISGTYPQETLSKGDATRTGAFFTLTASNSVSAGWNLYDNNTIMISSTYGGNISSVVLNITPKSKFDFTKLNVYPGSMKRSGNVITISGINSSSVTITGTASGGAYGCVVTAATITGTTALSLTSTGDDNVKTFTMPSANVTISAEFEEIPFVAVTAHEGATGEYWATYYNSTTSFTADANTTVFQAALSGDQLTLTVVPDREIPADKAVILKSSAATITLTPATTTQTLSGNMLQGTTAELTGAAGNIYVLNKTNENGVGFYKLKSTGTIGANKAYLTYSGASAPEFLGFGETTSISEIEKMRNVENETFYDLQGRRVAQPTKGLYIVNGKKVVIK